MQIQLKRRNFQGLLLTTMPITNGDRAGPALSICWRSSLQFRWDLLILLLDSQTFSQDFTVLQAAWTTRIRGNLQKEHWWISFSMWTTIRVLKERSEQDSVRASSKISKMVMRLQSISGLPKPSIFQMGTWVRFHLSWLLLGVELLHSDPFGNRSSLNKKSSKGLHQSTSSLDARMKNQTSCGMKLIFWKDPCWRGTVHIQGWSASQRSMYRIRFTRMVSRSLRRSFSIRAGSMFVGESAWLRRSTPSWSTSLPSMEGLESKALPQSWTRWKKRGDIVKTFLANERHSIKVAWSNFSFDYLFQIQYIHFKLISNKLLLLICKSYMVQCLTSCVSTELQQASSWKKNLFLSSNRHCVHFSVGWNFCEIKYFQDPGFVCLYLEWRPVFLKLFPHLIFLRNKANEYLQNSLAYQEYCHWCLNRVRMLQDNIVMT